MPHTVASDLGLHCLPLNKQLSTQMKIIKIDLSKGCRPGPDVYSEASDLESTLFDSHPAMLGTMKRSKVDLFKF